MTRKSLVPLELPGDPVNPLDAATKQYVDAHAGGGSVEEVFVGTADPGVAFELWYDTDAPGGPAGVIPAPYDSYPNSIGPYNDPGTSGLWACGDHTHSAPNMPRTKYHYYEASAVESGDIAATPVEITNYTLAALAGRVYDIRAYVTIVSRTGTVTGGRTRLLIGGVSAFEKDNYISAANVACCGDISGTWIAGSTGDVNIKLDLTKSWWGATNVRYVRGPGTPIGMTIFDMGPVV